jgi:hypothetical protein
MSYWSNNTELLDKITAEALPEPWRTQVESDEINLLDVPVEIRDKAMIEGERDYWANMTDWVHERAKHGGC